MSKEKVCDISKCSLEYGSCQKGTTCCRFCENRRECEFPCQLIYKGEKCKHYKGVNVWWS